MKKAALTLLAIAGLCCSSEKTAEVAPIRAIPTIEIKANECKEICGGKICYENIWTEVNSRKLERYTIASEGFDNYTNLGGKMIVAGKCIFYKLSADPDSLVLEKLR